MTHDNRQVTSPEKGFTIIELMLAMTVFSVILVAAAAGLIQIGRMYYQAVITSRTQDTARAITDELSSAIQFSGSSPVFYAEDSEEVKAICIGNSRYSYMLNRQLAGDANHVLWRDEVEDNACTPADITNDQGDDGVELMGENMRLSKFEVENVRAEDYQISISIAYGEDDLLVGIDEAGEDIAHDEAVRLICDPGGIGTQFCAISEFSTLVARRL